MSHPPSDPAPHPASHTVLHVPVPALEPYIRGRHLVEGPEWISPDPGHVHAHITLLGPFADAAALAEGLEDDLDEVFGAVAPFTFSLGEVRVFPSGLLYLHPDPPEPFVAVTEALAARYPAYPPYAGAFAPVPHLSLCALGPGRDLGTVEAELAPLLPVRARATQAWLVRYQPHASRVLRRFRLGG